MIPEHTFDLQQIISQLRHVPGHCGPPDGRNGSPARPESLGRFQVSASVPLMAATVLDMNLLDRWLLAIASLLFLVAILTWFGLLPR